MLRGREVLTGMRCVRWEGLAGLAQPQGHGSGSAARSRFLGGRGRPPPFKMARSTRTLVPFGAVEYCFFRKGGWFCLAHHLPTLAEVTIRETGALALCAWGVYVPGETQRVRGEREGFGEKPPGKNTHGGAKEGGRLLLLSLGPGCCLFPEWGGVTGGGGGTLFSRFVFPCSFCS